MEEAGGSVGMTDEMGWPVRMLDGKRMCARPGPGHYGAVEEFRIDGYCSCECRDMHDLEEQIERLERALLVCVKAYDARSPRMMGEATEAARTILGVSK